MGKEAVAKNAGSRARPKVRRLVEKSKPEGGIVTKPDDNFCTFILKPEHRGKIIAMVGGQKKEVIAFGTRYRHVVEKARRLAGNRFSIMFAPETGVLYTR